MEQRVMLINAWLSRRYTKSQLCEQFNISRPTAANVVAYAEIILEHSRRRQLIILGQRIVERTKTRCSATELDNILADHLFFCIYVATMLVILCTKSKK